MSARRWAPGDVALVRNEYDVWNVAIRSVVPEGFVWKYGVSDMVSPRDAEARPLVVIDPENAEQVARLADLRGRIWGGDEAHTYVSAMQAALREFANPTPPKPDEPTGLGAVVEDAEGQRWVRVVGRGLTFAWRPEGATTDYGDTRYWIKVDAVRVLSEGFTP